MKNQEIKNSGFTLRPMTSAEWLYAWRQSMQIEGQTGFIGYLRGDFGASGNEFWSSFFDGNSRLWKTALFRDELDLVINSLRKPTWPMHSLSDWRQWLAQPDHAAVFQDGWRTLYGFRADTEAHTFLFNCRTEKGDYHFYCYCYCRKCLEFHMEKAEMGIRFVNSSYDPLFQLPDGGKIQIAYSDGQTKTAVARYIDDTHFELGEGTTILFHICQFAEHMEKIGAHYSPAANGGDPV